MLTFISQPRSRCRMSAMANMLAPLTSTVMKVNEIPATEAADMVILPDPGEPPDKHRRRAGINNDADHTPTAWGRSPQYIPVSALTYPSGTPTAEDGPRHAEGTVPVRPRGAPASRIGMQHTMRAATPKQGPGGGHAAMTSFVGRRRE